MIRCTASMTSDQRPCSTARRDSASASRAMPLLAFARALERRCRYRPRRATAPTGRVRRRPRKLPEQRNAGVWACAAPALSSPPWHVSQRFSRMAYHYRPSGTTLTPESGTPDHPGTTPNHPQQRLSISGFGVRVPDGVRDTRSAACEPLTWFYFGPMPCFAIFSALRRICSEGCIQCSGGGVPDGASCEVDVLGHRRTGRVPTGRPFAQMWHGSGTRARQATELLVNEWVFGEGLLAGRRAAAGKEGTDAESAGR
jgi:hypothetical protein